MVEFTKTCNQYRHKLNVGHFFSSIILPPFCLKKIDFQKNAVRRNWVISFNLGCDDMNLGESFVMTWLKMNRFKMNRFWLINVFSGNLNTINLKLFRNRRGIYRFKKKLMKYSWKINPLGVHRSMRGCILDVNSEGRGW